MEVESRRRKTWTSAETPAGATRRHTAVCAAQGGVPGARSCARGARTCVLAQLFELGLRLGLRLVLGLGHGRVARRLSLLRPAIGVSRKVAADELLKARVSRKIHELVLLVKVHHNCRVAISQAIAIALHRGDGVAAPAYVAAALPAPHVLGAPKCSRLAAECLDHRRLGFRQNRRVHACCDRCRCRDIDDVVIGGVLVFDNVVLEPDAAWIAPRGHRIS